MAARLPKVWPRRPPRLPLRIAAPIAGLRGPRLGVRWLDSLSARLLLLTAVLVLAAQLLILVPSLAGFENSWLADRAHQADVASLAVDAAPSGVLSSQLSAKALAGAGVVSVAVQTKGVRRLLLAAPHMEQAPALVDLRTQSPLDFLIQPFIALGPRPPGMLRVVARPQLRPADFVEIVLPTAPLRAAMTAYLVRLVLISVLISVVAGIVVYLLLAALLVRPIIRLTEAMERFRARPEDPAARLAPSACNFQPWRFIGQRLANPSRSTQ